MKCKNCKHWNREDNSCVEIIEDEWSKRSKNNSITIEYSVLDDSGLTIELFTGPDFGCIKFKQK